MSKMYYLVANFQESPSVYYAPSFRTLHSQCP